MRDRKDVDSDGRGAGEDLGQVKGGETVIRIFGSENLFSIKEK